MRALPTIAMCRFGHFHCLSSILWLVRADNRCHCSDTHFISPWYSEPCETVPLYALIRTSLPFYSVSLSLSSSHLTLATRHTRLQSSHLSEAPFRQATMAATRSRWQSAPTEVSIAKTAPTSRLGIRLPASLLTCFQIIWEIALAVESDRDFAKMRELCRRFQSAIDGDMGSLWRRRFLQEFDRPASVAPWVAIFVANRAFEILHKRRRSLLRRPLSFRRPISLKRQAQTLAVIRDLIVGTRSCGTTVVFIRY